MSDEERSEEPRKPASAWHCGHFFYRFDRSRLRTLGPSELSDGCREFIVALDAAQPRAPSRLQTFLVTGHRADFGLLMLDADPLAIDGVHQRLTAGLLGPAIRPVWSFVSMTEVSEYVPDVEQYGQRLVAEGVDPQSTEYQAKLEQYGHRLETIRRQRLTPELPRWPALCFYPMNKRREPGANWFLLDFSERERLMSAHGETGTKFAGKVTQLITAAMGLDDWEWGVTLWARNAEFLKQIVYRMRFDEVTARYAQFGPFYAGYQAVPAKILSHCRIGLQPGGDPGLRG